MCALLCVIQRLKGHAEAALWYRAKQLPLPNNLVVHGNPPNPVRRSHRDNPNKKHAKNDEDFARRWEREYESRSRKHPEIVVCSPLFIALGWNAPVLSEEDQLAVFGRVPVTQKPPDFDFIHFDALVRQVKIDVRRE